MNKLINETSPYLLQHAHNPVEWYAWKPEAFEKAKAEDKPILVSIGYSTCHWCHVMERESFEVVDTAAFMNEHFVNIKVDREERPDVDQIYMEACQVISGGGGWPLNCFLTPDGRPFFAGTYYPPEPAYQRPSWIQLLTNMVNAYKTQRQVVEEQADKLTDIIRNADSNFIKKGVSFENSLKNAQNTEGTFTRDKLDNIYYALRERFDRVDGGFGGAPKFPSTFCIQFLLDYYFYTKNEEALEHAELSLTKMIQGGIYDQLGGGFARYATDREWLIPHFEKMLYDNALILNNLCDAYKITKKDIYRETIEETLAFIEREMVAPPAPQSGVLFGGFYSAYDADSEGVEGKFYVWSKKEIDIILGEDAVLFCAFYDVTEEGNWEETNILWRHKSYEEFAQAASIDVSVLKEKLKILRDKLFKIRDLRTKVGLDDKILLSWNALIISSYAKAYEALNTATPSRDEAASIKGYKKMAVDGLDFILKKFKKSDYAFFHTYKNGQAQYDAFLEDYAYLIEAILDVYQITFEKSYLYEAKALCDYVLQNFLDTNDNLFYFTSEKQTDILLRKKDLYDNATPSGNSTMVRNLRRMGIFFDEKQYKILTINMLQAVGDVIERYPSGFGRWASGFLSIVFPPLEIAVVGKNAFEKVLQINTLFLPNKIVMASVEEDNALPLLKDKKNEGDSCIYVCQDYACKMPVKTVNEMLKAL